MREKKNLDLISYVPQFFLKKKEEQGSKPESLIFRPKVQLTAEKEDLEEYILQILLFITSNSSEVRIRQNL